MTVQVVLFDLGGVLLPFDRERRVRVMSRALAIAPDAARGFMASDLHARLDVGAADVADLAAALAALAQRPVSDAEARALILSVFEAPNIELWALAARLRDRLPVGGFSDNPAFVAELFPPGAVLDPMFWSSELRRSKAEPAAFAAVAKRLGVDPAAILFIDDSPANVDRARGLGWDAVLFRSNASLAEALRSRRLVD